MSGVGGECEEYRVIEAVREALDKRGFRFYQAPLFARLSCYEKKGATKFYYDIYYPGFVIEISGEAGDKVVVNDIHVERTCECGG